MDPSSSPILDFKSWECMWLHTCDKAETGFLVLNTGQNSKFSTNAVWKPKVDSSGGMQPKVDLWPPRAYMNTHTHHHIQAGDRKKGRGQELKFSC